LKTVDLRSKAPQESGHRTEPARLSEIGSFRQETGENALETDHLSTFFVPFMRDGNTRCLEDNSLRIFSPVSRRTWTVTSHRAFCRQTP